jgi:hypothetical protein
MIGQYHIFNLNKVDLDMYLYVWDNIQNRRYKLLRILSKIFGLYIGKFINMGLILYKDQI